MANETSPLISETSPGPEAPEAPEIPEIPQEAPLRRSRTDEELPIPSNLKYILLSLWTSSFLSAADTTIVSTTATAIASSMDGSDMLTWIATSYLLTNAIFQPLVGKISDVYGRRSTLICAQLWFVLGCFFCAISPTVTAFSVSRAVAGVGGGGMSALSSIIVTDVVPLRLRGMYQGYANVIYAAGQFVGPVIGSMFLTANEKSGWRWMFGLQVPLVLFTSFLAYRNVHEFRVNAEERAKDRKLSNLKEIDLPGSVALALVVTSVLMLFQANSKLQAQVCAAAIVVSVVAFYLVERFVSTSYIIPPSAFRGILRISSLIAFFGTMAIYSMNFILPVYIQIVQDFSSFQVGVFNGFSVFSSAGGSLLAGMLLRTEKRLKPHETVRRAVNVTIFSCVCLFTGTFLSMLIIRTFKPTVSRVDLNYSKMGLLVLTYVLATIGYGCFLVSLLILVVGKMGMRNQASVTGMNYMFRSMGSVSGVGTSLGMYNLILNRELYTYFVKKGKDDGQNLFDKLQKSSFFVRNGLPEKYVKKVLKIYRESLGDSMVMVSIMGTLALMLALLMKLYHRNEQSKLAEIQRLRSV